MQLKTARLIYFSPTGTTKKIVKAIYQGLNIEKSEVTDLTSPTIRMQDRIDVQEDIIILGVPVYEERIPYFLNSIIGNINGHGKPIILVSVYGDIGNGIALNELETFCTQNKMVVVGAASFIGEHSFSTKELSVAEGRPDAKDLEMAVEFGRAVCNKLEKCNSILNLRVSIPAGRIPIIARVLPSNSARIFTKQPVVDRSICIKCNACVKACPMNAIIEDTLEINEELCLRCFACVKICPSKAREKEYKKRLLVKNFLRKGSRVRKEPSLYIE